MTVSSQTPISEGILGIKINFVSTCETPHFDWIFQCPKELTTLTPTRPGFLMPSSSISFSPSLQPHPPPAHRSSSVSS